MSIYLALSVLDVVLTAAVLAKTGSEIEMNLFAAYLYDQSGIYGLIILKSLSVLTVVTIICILKWLGHKRNANMVELIACIASAIAVYFGVLSYAQLY